MGKSCVCAICGEPFRVSDSRMRDSVSRVVQHLQCYIDNWGYKSSQMAYLEQEHGKSIRDVLIDCLKRTASTVEVLDKLHITMPTLKRWTKDHLGLTLSEAIVRYRKHVDNVGKPQHLIKARRLEGQPLLDKLIDTLATDSIESHARRMGVSAATLSRIVSGFGMSYREFREKALARELG